MLWLSTVKNLTAEALDLIFLHLQDPAVEEVASVEIVAVSVAVVASEEAIVAASAAVVASEEAIVAASAAVVASVDVVDAVDSVVEMTQ